MTMMGGVYEHTVVAREFYLEGVVATIALVLGNKAT